MGNYIYSSEFAIYGRRKDTNRYEMIEEIKEGNPMSRFKHETYAYGLDKKHKEMKALYLYCGYNRICKTEKLINQEVLYIIINFSTAITAEEWDSCQEQIPSVYVDLAWLERSFTQQFVEMNDNDPFKRRYQNYKLSMKT